jgi:hypothetical protein
MIHAYSGAGGNIGAYRIDGDHIYSIGSIVALIMKIAEKQQE